jgi:hypothetical protein
MKTMFTDPIVEEVRAAREHLAAECGFDIHRMIRRARQRSREAGIRVVTVSEMIQRSHPVAGRPGRVKKKPRR